MGLGFFLKVTFERSLFSYIVIFLETVSLGRVVVTLIGNKYHPWIFLPQ